MEVMAKAAFAIESNAQRDPDDQFVKHANAIFKPNLRRPGLWIFSCFP